MQQIATLGIGLRPRMFFRFTRWMRRLPKPLEFRASEMQQGQILTVADALIAATASVHGAVLVTRNIKDFQNLGVPLVNPFLK